MAPSQKNASVNPVSLTRGIRYIELSPDRGRLYHRHGRQFPRRRPPRQRSSGRSRRASLRSLFSFCLGLRLQRSAGAPPLRKFTPNWRVRSGSFGCQSVHPMAVVIADARVQCQECFENLLLTEHIEGPRSGCRGRGRVTAHKIIETLTQYHGTARKELLPLAVDLLTTVLQTPSRVSA